MKHFNFLLLVIGLIIMGCNSKSDYEIMPLNQTIKGDLGNYFSIIPENYKIVKSQKIGKDWELVIKIKCISKPTNILINDIKENKKNISLKLIITDNAGKPISGIKETEISSNNWNDNDSFEKIKRLLSGNVNAIEWIVFNIETDINSEFKDKLPSSELKFEISSNIENNQQYSNTYTSTESTEIVSASDYGGEVDNSYNTSDCSSLLSEYENFVDDYISFVKKAANGDYSAMANATELMTKAENIGRKIQNMGEVQAGSSCWSKYIRLQTKLTNAAMNLTKNLPKSF